MPKLAIITDGTKLKTHIASTLKTYATVGERVHIGVVSGLWHAATFGDPSRLNQIYSGLRSNDQQAVKMYVRRCQIINGLNGESPEGKNSEVIQAAALAGSILGFEKGEFVVLGGHSNGEKAISDEAVQLLGFIEKRFIDPDGETDRMVLDRNNFAEVKVMQDVDVVDKLMKEIKATQTDSETRKFSLSAATKSLLDQMYDLLDTRKGQLTLDAG